MLSGEELGLLILLLAVFAGMIALNLYLARTLSGSELIFQRWLGARSFLLENINPYGADVARQVQLLAYNGRTAYSSEFPFALSDPLFILLLYTPLALLREGVNILLPAYDSYFGFPFVRAVWMLLSEMALIGIVMQSIRLSEWEPPRWLYGLLFFLGLFGFFSLNALALGTPAILLTLLYLSILLALRAGRDELAGGLLSLAFYQWEVGGLFFMFILTLIVAHRRWTVLKTLVMALFVFLAVAFLADQNWLIPYFRAVLSNWYRTPFLNLSSMTNTWFPSVRFNLGGFISLAIGGLVFFEWIGSVNTNFQRIFWVAALSLAATPLVGFAIFPSNHVVLTPALVLIIALVWERWRRNRILMTIFVFSLALFVPFVLYLQTAVVYSRIYTNLLSILPPAGTIVGLYWMRWWVVRTPRPWADQIGVRS